VDLKDELKKQINIVEQLKRLVDDNELTPELIEAFMGESTQSFEIADAINEAIVEKEIELDGLNSYMKKLTERKNRIENTIENLRGSFLLLLNAAGVNTIKRPHYTASLKEAPITLEIIDESKIPSSFFKTEIVLDKTLLKNLLKEGSEVEGAKLVRKGYQIQIRRA
jgi:hypothetical protein